MTCPYVLTMDTFGPITDNANGINEMAGAGEEVRKNYRPSGCGRQYHQSPDQGLCHGLRRSRSFPALPGLHGQCQLLTPNTAGISPMTTVDIVKHRGLRRRSAGRHDCLPVQLLGNQRRRQDCLQDYRRSPPPVPSRPGNPESQGPGHPHTPDYAKAVDITARAGLREMISTRTAARPWPLSSSVLFSASFQVMMQPWLSPRS